MLNFIPNLKLAKADDATPGGAPVVPPAPPAKPPEQQPPAAVTPPIEEGGSEFDDFGYPTAPAPEAPPKAGEKPKAGDKPPKAPVKEPDEVKDPATGYGIEPPKVEEIVPPPADPNAPPVVPDDFDKALEGVPKVDADEMKAFATENKVGADVVKKWADKVKANIEKAKVNATTMERQIEQQKSQQRATWHKELKEDPVFGGDKFQFHLSRAEKVLSEFMPELKKELTDAKQMLRPSVMRGLAKIADQLYSSEALVQGDPVVPTPDEDEVDDALSYYQ